MVVLPVAVGLHTVVVVDVLAAVIGVLAVVVGVHSATVVGSRAVVVGVHSAAVVVVVGGFGVPSFSRDSKQLTNNFFKNVAKF